MGDYFFIIIKVLIQCKTLCTAPSTMRRDVIHVGFFALQLAAGEEFIESNTQKICKAESNVGVVLLLQIFRILPLFLLKPYYFHALVQPSPSLLLVSLGSRDFSQQFWAGRKAEEEEINKFFLKEPLPMEKLLYVLQLPGGIAFS